MPATSMRIRAASAGMSGIGYSRRSVLPGPTRTAANTCSATKTPPFVTRGLDPRVHRLCLSWMDCRVEPGNDESGCIAMLRALNTDAEHVAALDRVRAWTRARFGLADNATVAVSQVSC